MGGAWKKPLPKGCPDGREARKARRVDRSVADGSEVRKGGAEGPVGRSQRGGPTARKGQRAEHGREGSAESPAGGSQRSGREGGEEGGSRQGGRKGGAEGPADGSRTGGRRGRYVNGHAKKHYEDAQIPLTNHKKTEKQEKVQHTVCMDCSSYSTYCYRCDDFVVNDTKLGLVQKVREHLQNLENSAFTADRHRKRKLVENSSLNSKSLKVNGSTNAVCATGLRNLGNTCFMNAILQSLSNIQQFCCYFKELPAVELRNGKTAGRRTYHTRSQGDNNVSLVEEFRKTLCALWQGSQTAFSPESLFYVVWKIMPNFRGYQQQDAHEFMRYLLDHLHLELQGGFNGVSRSVILQENSGLSASNKCCINGASTVVTAIFGGILQNEVNCLICGTESRKFDPFLDLSLDIPSQFRNKRTKNQENGPMCTLRGKSSW
ncbi:hypothetical protein KIL84_014825 [Mauremys mutica]|uniref:ubiquitinyl hydrolase 1 n=1 Tax=Mauremys mutica TaxID=74926 RepID=A0A9D3XMG0_9SAUR|nr:hypothetical protein KIL84_014825 [Mauremys mutica]